MRMDLLRVRGLHRRELLLELLHLFSAGSKRRSRRKEQRARVLTQKYMLSIVNNDFTIPLNVSKRLRRFKLKMSRIE